MRDLLNAASPAVRAQLTEGSFYRGFVTIDAVGLPTVEPPTQAGFPFFEENFLEGWIYYTRLSQGSANGIAMVALESVPEATDVRLKGFYGGTDNREEIDVSSRRCARRLIVQPTLDACPAGFDGPLARIHLRVFRSTPLSGSSRAVVFTWVPGLTGGPSVFCDDPANSCSQDYQFRQYTEAGAVVAGNDPSRRLDHVVNVIENSELSGGASGWISIIGIPNVLIELQVYGLSFNSASPSGDPDLTWDAIFEAYVLTDVEGLAGSG